MYGLETKLFVLKLKLIFLDLMVLHFLCFRQVAAEQVSAAQSLVSWLSP